MNCWWIYTPEGGGEDVTIGSRHVAPSPEAAAIVLEFIRTTDREQAEEWRQALAKGEVPNHDPVASGLASLRWAQRELGMSLDQLEQRYRREPGMAQLVEILRSEAAGAQTVAAEGDGAN
jgi:hypothetical protein